MVERVHSGPVVGLLGQLILLFVLSETVGLGAVGWLVGTACGVVTTLSLSYGMTLSGRLTLGAANRVTLLRATLVGGVTALLSDALLGPTNLTVLVGLAVVALVLDGVDGWVARHTGTTSALGARFDMEVDAFLILALSVYVAQLVGPWVLAIGAARYAFWAAGRLVPWMATPLPLRYWRKPVAAIQGIVLTAAVAGFLPTGWTAVTIVIALLLLTESFGRDVLWQWRQHRQPAVHTRASADSVLVGGRTQGCTSVAEAERPARVVATRAADSARPARGLVRAGLPRPARPLHPRRVGPVAGRRSATGRPRRCCCRRPPDVSWPRSPAWSWVCWRCSRSSTSASSR